MAASDRNYPFWPKGSPQDAARIVQHQKAMQLKDLAVNQIFSGRTDQIPAVQRVAPRQPKALKPGSNDNQEVGAYGSTLYDLFMQPYTQKTSGQ
jgi:hypothetical protein